MGPDGWALGRAADKIGVAFKHGGDEAAAGRGGTEEVLVNIGDFISAESKAVALSSAAAPEINAGGPTLVLRFRESTLVVSQ